MNLQTITLDLDQNMVIPRAQPQGTVASSAQSKPQNENGTYFFLGAFLAGFVGAVAVLITVMFCDIHHQKFHKDCKVSIFADHPPDGYDWSGHRVGRTDTVDPANP